MPGLSDPESRHRFGRMAVICSALLLGACSVTPKKGPTKVVTPVRDADIADLTRISQKLAELPAVSDERLKIDSACSTQLLDEFKSRYFSRWTTSVPLYDFEESRDFMRKEVNGGWYGTNKRKVSRKQLQGLLENCALKSFPSRSDTAIAAAPGHLRGLPTHMPFYEKRNDEPFDMLSYPQVKLNEPLRVLHTSKDGVWLFVETAYSNGWLEARDVALVDAELIDSWMQAPHLVMIQDYQAVSDGRGIGTYPAKIGTILPLAQSWDGWWEVRVASAGEGGKAEIRTSRILRAAAAPFPLAFNKENVALIGDQLLGQPYGWGEQYDLRDCSALLRDFFMPFGIWLPRASSDQIASVPRRVPLVELAALEKEKLIMSKSLPFLTLLFKPGHIMLYAGEDREGRPLAFHGSWSIRVQEGEGARKQIIGISAITTLAPGKELGLVPGSSLLEKVTEMGTVTERCSAAK